MSRRDTEKIILKDDSIQVPVINTSLTIYLYLVN